MAQVQPEKFFRFAGDHCDMLLELYRHCGRKSISESRLSQVIGRYITAESPSTAYLVERMLRLGFLEYAPDTDRTYEMPHVISRLLGFLLQEYRLTSVEVIQGYLKALDRYCLELDQAGGRVDGDAVVRIVYEIDEHIERMRSDSLNNRQRIIADCVKAKINSGKSSVRQRFELINHLYTKYLMPMRDMIDVSKEMDTQLERLQRSLTAGKDRFECDRQVRQLYDRTLARLFRLKRDIDADFRESYRELMPLYERCRKETLIAQGAAAALKGIARQGVKTLDLANRLGLASFRTQGLIDDAGLAAYLYGISLYEPQEVSIDPDQAVDEVPVFTGLGDLKGHLHGLPYIDDVLQWILEVFPQEGVAGHLRVYGMFHTEGLGHLSFSDEPNLYESHGITLKACPMTWIKETSDV